ncbi:hypothetical protein BJ875DRAFT_173440 [Amylocarpus encephaloides]|uniref:Uncharacterized protein n=1 Tax=Amylocarpus encephaloides TaxID=45428 RepID=A0A9P8C1H3_9HELO|nr:hypothetical protein BJ875DRAFT_173440 [Amylocarpus encephaloides]
MSPGRRPSIHGNQYQNVQIGGSGPAHLGNAYHFSRENPLKDLPFATNAPFNSSSHQHEPARLPDTRVDLLQGIYDWDDGAHRQDERCIF